MHIGSTFQASNADAGKFTNASYTKTKLHKSISSSSSDSESVSTHPSDLHGVQSGNEQRSESLLSSSSAQYSRTSTSSSGHNSDTVSSLSSQRSSEEELISESKLLDHKSSRSNSSHTLTSSETDDDFEQREYTLKHSESTQSSLKGRRQSSDSMTDVSPLTSPEKSPNVHHRSRPKRDQIPDELNDVPVRHITKLNVVFKNDIDEPDKTDKKKMSNHKRLDYHSIQWSSSDSEDDANPHSNGQDYSKARAHNKRTQSLREDSAAYHHRQRLLDSAARGSMDISSLLETVLEFEKQNYQRKVSFFISVF